MARKKSTTGNLTLNKMADEGKKALLFMGGVLAGTQVLKAIDRKSGGMAGVMGLDGESRKMLAPSLTAVIGLAVSATSQNEAIRSMGYGMASTGGAVMAQEMTGVQFLPNTPVATPRLIQGVGYSMEELPDPSISGLAGEPVFADEEGNLFDADYNLVNGVDGEDFEDEEDGEIIAADDDDGVEGVDGEIIPGMGATNGGDNEIIPGMGGTGSIPNYGTII